MAFYFANDVKHVHGGSKLNFNNQFKEVQSRRKFFDANERALAKMSGNAAAVIPQDVYREFDTVTKRIMRSDEGDTILNDLLPLARSVNIGKIEYKFRRASDSGNAKTTISGQTPVTMDKAKYSYDQTIIPVHQDAFGREWRELEGQRSEGFDALIDDQENSVRAARRQMVDWILNGDSSVVFNGNSWTGVKNETTRVARVDLDADGLNINFSSAAATAQDMRNGFKSLRDTLRITNKVSGQLTVYVSREILSNMERYYSDNEAGYQTILQAVRSLTGIADVKETDQLSGNEVIMMALESSTIMPLVGMGVTTIPVPRATPFDQHNFITWGAMGLMVKTDYDNRTGVLYAAEFA